MTHSLTQRLGNIDLRKELQFHTNRPFLNVVPSNLGPPAGCDPYTKPNVPHIHTNAVNKKMVLQMGLARPIFCLFRPFHNVKPNLVYNLKKRRCCAWDSNPGRRMKGWQPQTKSQWRPQHKKKL